MEQDAKHDDTLPEVEIVGVSYEEQLTLAKRGIVERAICRNEGNISRAARSLQITRCGVHLILDKTTNPDPKESSRMDDTIDMRHAMFTLGLWPSVGQQQPPL